MNLVRCRARKVDLRDLLLLFFWANDPSTRQNAVSQRRIRLIEHLKWFRRSLANDSHVMMIVSGQILGEPRSEKMMFFSLLTRADGKSEITVNVGPRYRGRGLSAMLLAKALSEIDGVITGPKILVARIRKENVPSKKMFASVGFQEIGEDGEFVEFQKTH